MGSIILFECLGTTLTADDVDFLGAAYAYRITDSYVLWEHQQSKRAISACGMCISSICDVFLVTASTIDIIRLSPAAVCA